MIDINRFETGGFTELNVAETKIKNRGYNVEPVQLYYTLSSRHARVTVRPDKVDKLIKEKTAVPLRDYIDHNGNILCIKNEKIMKNTVSYIAVKIRHKRVYEIYIPPDISDIIGGYSLRRHINRYLEDIDELNPVKQFSAQKELSRELDLPYAGSNMYSARAMAAQMLLDRLAVIMGLEEFKNPWYVSESGRRYESQDM